MGVSGCGKTTIGKLLAGQSGLPFFDADDYHPEENIMKMRNGIPLNDEDREPWLIKLASLLIGRESKGGAVLACSALKEKYRSQLQKDLKEKIYWVHLEGTKEVLQERLQKRSHAYMSPSLLSSQLEALERPAYALHIPVTLSPEKIVEEIISKIKHMQNDLSEFGIVGLGVMGKNLALNLLDKGVKLAVYNREVPSKEVEVARSFAGRNPLCRGYDDLYLFAAALQRPRKILLMIQAGEAVDSIIRQLAPHLQEGDLLMDGGNSHFLDTRRRMDALSEKGISYLGVGVSGGEEGARYGPSVMPGGTAKGYEHAAGYLELLAAKDYSGKPCCTYVGPEGSGHFVKMVHNGIEYAEMQIIAEIYFILKHLPGMSNEKMREVFHGWEKEGLGSFLLEITQDILVKKEGQEFLLDKILDAAEQKGTGGWSVKAAMDLGVPLSTITEAVVARMLSSIKEQRMKASALYGVQHGNFQISPDQLRNAYRAARLINHAIGFNMIREASLRYSWNLNLSEISRIWTNGCIIRSPLMESLSLYFKESSQLMVHPEVAGQLKDSWNDLATAVSGGLQNGLALPVLSSSLNYFLGYINGDSPANLIQAQRDYFGAHTYRRKDSGEDKYFHTEWMA